MRRLAIVIALALLAPAAGAGVPPPVRTDQFGYTPSEIKWAAVSTPAASFQVIRVMDDVAVYSGTLSLRRASDPASGDDVYAADFTAVTTPGQYLVRVPGVGDSAPFLIHAAVYDEMYRRFLKGLYYQRCGTAIPPGYGGMWTHDACHDEAGGIASYDWTTTGGAPGNYRDTIGGWHDAGDYGKYSTNNDYAVGILLQAYLLYPAKYAQDDCGIPESGNGVPDLLDEARWALTWMFRMQYPDGSVIHRESIANYAGIYSPEGDPITRYYTSASSDATADHCAAMALAARAYATVDPAFAAACSTSAIAAWNWLLAHPDRVPAGGFTNLYGHTGATYIAGSEIGRRLWAAAEIFRLNGTAAAKSYFDAHWGENLDFNGVWYPDSWGDLANMGAFAYRDAPGATPGLVSGNWWSVESSTGSSSDGWNTRVAQDGYGCAASTGDYYWGFTGVILRYAWTLLEGRRYGGPAAYEQAARGQLHYILGRNPMGKVYVTGIGVNPVLHAHGAWNLAAGYVDLDDALCHPVPYLLIGGPNQADNGGISPWPGRCYEDIADPDYGNQGNYTLNETSVNIQASLIVLAGYFSTGGTVTGVPEESAPPVLTRILPASPNPFRESTVLAWEGTPGTVSLFDAAGRLVRSLTAAPAVDFRHSLTWDGRDASGADVPAGVYFVRYPAPDGRQKIVRLRR